MNRKALDKSGERKVNLFEEGVALKRKMFSKPTGDLLLKIQNPFRLKIFHPPLERKSGGFWMPLGIFF